MKIPKQVKIGNQIFKVEPLTADGDEYYGRASLKGQWIRLDMELQPDHLAEAFLHEMLHIICQRHKWSEIDQNEKIIHPLACAIYQVLKENGFLKV